MNHKLIVFILTFFGFVSVIDAQNTWLRNFGSSQFDLLDKVGADDDGNVYVAGRIRGNTQLGDTLITKIGAASYNYILVKMDERGNYLWVVNFYQNSAAIDEVSGIDIDKQGNVYVAILKPGILFKYSNSGVKLFEKVFQAWNARLGNVIVDDSNFVWTCGSFSQNNFSLDGLPPMLHHGGTSLYVARLDSTGRARQVFPVGSNSLSGRVADIALRDSIVVLSAFGLFNVYIKNDTFFNNKALTITFKRNGDLLWAKPIQVINGTGVIANQALTILNTGEVAIAGNFTEPINISGTVLSNPNDRENFFMALYNRDGSLAWARQANSSYATTYEMQTTADNKIAVSFDYNFSFSFGGKSVGDGLSNKRYAGVMSVLPNGSAEWIKAFGQSDWTYARGFAIDGKGNWYTGGNFQSTTTNNIDGNLVTAVGESDFYVIKNFKLPEPGIGNSKFCSNSTSQVIQATGTNVRWYADSLLTNLLFSGNNYAVNIDSSLLLFVTQNQGGAVSNPKKVLVNRYHLRTVQLVKSGDSLMISPMIGSTFSWYKDKVLQQGNTGIFRVTQSGIYHAVVLDSNGCTLFTDSMNIIVSGLVDKYIDENNINIFPNPAAGVVYIESEMPIQHLLLYNNLGQLIATGTDNELDIKDAANGLYWIRVIYESGSYTQRLIIGR
ncbi:MAG: T9SS type A sorting domain-containing protein [Bacteroidia bacterium]|jgi:hypothetical protein|nr:T9SS type A sorting domain-containing protein [Bacteroidia bacterium]